MTPEATIALIGLIIICITFGVAAFKLFTKKIPRRNLRSAPFEKKWKALQGLCADKANWPEALKKADALLNQALKKRHFKGKSTGEMLVSAQHQLTDNDGVWFGHKLSKKANEDPELKLKERDVKDALLGIGQALKDLNAL